MNVALIHDKLHIKSFWESKAAVEQQNVEKEEKRAESSALCRLRAQWVVRLENRNKHLKKLDTRKVEIAKSPDQENESPDQEVKSADEEVESADREVESADQENESPDQEVELADEEVESADQENESPDQEV